MVASIAVSAQSQSHLKFQGIPITGTFAQFEAKLKAKGWVYDYQASKDLDADTRVYKGTFAGERGLLYVDRTPISKVVFGISFFSKEFFSEDIARKSVQRHVEALRRTYPNAIEWESEDEYKQFNLSNGVIRCGMLDYNDGAYCSQLIYLDDTNQEKYLNERDSDY